MSPTVLSSDQNVGDQVQASSELMPEPEVDAGALLAAMGELARTLHHHRASLADMLALIVATATASVPGATSAGISLAAGRGGLESRAATDDVPRLVADVQTEVGQGPCLQAMIDQVPIRIDDLTADRRWPAFVPRLAGQPIGSMLSLPLRTTGKSFGSLSLYAPAPGAFGPQSVSICAVLASHAAVALADARNEQGLRGALDNRDLIGQAKGILMERYKITDQEAFELLVRASQHSNVKLRDVAEALAVSGELGPPAR